MPLCTMQSCWVLILFFVLALQNAISKRSSKTKSVEETREEIMKKGFAATKDLSSAEEEMVATEVEKFMAERRAQKELKKRNEESEGVRLVDVIPKKDGFSPKEHGMFRTTEEEEDDDNNRSKPRIALTPQVDIPGGTFYFGTQTTVKDKIAPAVPRDGAGVRKKVTVKPFKIDIHEVSNLQFMDFVVDTGYSTESELFGWSFVLDGQVSEVVRSEVDGPKGYGRVKGAMHWLGVKAAAWDRPYGSDSDINTRMGLPVVHVSYNDALEYCTWAGRRLPTDKEWEFAARDGRSKENYPWGNNYEPGKMNIWDGDQFPNKNLLLDGFYGPAPVMQFGNSSQYGLYNMLGNVWEWVEKGKNPDSRTMRGGSFIDSVDGKFNHLVLVSTKQENSGDSAGSNIGFRCAADSDTHSSNNGKTGSSEANPTTTTRGGSSSDSSSTDSNSGGGSSKSSTGSAEAAEDRIEL